MGRYQHFSRLSWTKEYSVRQETLHQPLWEGSARLMPSVTSQSLPTTPRLLGPLCCEPCYDIFPFWVAHSSLELTVNWGTGFHFDTHRAKMHLYTKESEPDCAFVTTLPERCSSFLFKLSLLICTRVKGIRIRPQVWFLFVPDGVWCLISFFNLFLSDEAITFVFFPSFFFFVPHFEYGKIWIITSV